MAEYSKFGALDDRIAKDGDVGFIGFNNRLRPDQLPAGMLADAQNLRTDRRGEAQVRKGIDLTSNPITSGTNAMTLPFFILDATKTTNSTAISSNELLLNFASAHTLSAGKTAQVKLSGLSGVVPTTADGRYTATVVDTDTIKLTDKTYTNAASGNVTVEIPTLDDTTVNAIYGSCAFSDPNASASQYIIFAANTKAVAVNISTGTSIDITYPSGVAISSSVSMLQAFNKVFIFRNGSTAIENNLKISTISAATVTGSSNTANITTSANHNLVTGNIVTISGLGFSTTDPNGSNVTITRTGDTTFTYSLTAGGDETYTVSSSSTVITDFTKVSSGTYTQPVSIECAVKDFSIINSVGSLHTSQSLIVGNALSISNDGPTASCGLKLASGFSVNEVFSSGGSKTVSGVSISGTRITITCTDHGFVLNQPITFSDLNAGLNGNNSVAKVNSVNEFEVEVATTFSDDDDSGNVTPAAGVSFIVPSDTILSEKTQAEVRASDPIFIKKVSVGLGFTHMPAPPYAVYHQRRLIMPFNFTADATADSFTSRGILDEIIASDILDTDTYDQIYAQYRFNAGEADFNVALHSFSEDNLMVFNRNSIHLVSNTTTLEGASTRLLTNEVGCVARKSVQQVGNQVIFLSDNGVYSTQFFDEYNLRGTETPLSEPINVTIKRINKTYWNNSVSVYFDNRYFIAVPLDSEDGTVPATKNNAILVYNFLNKQWESIDQVNDTDFHINNLLVVGEGNDRGVYAVNDLGSVQKLDAREDGVDKVVTQVGSSEQNINVNGSLTTRQYTLQTLDRKNWKRFDMHIESSEFNTSEFDISAETENPDATLNIGTLSSFVGSALPEAEDVSIRGRIGNRRGYGLQFTINNTTGRPKIRAIEADGAISFRSTEKAQ
jgi:hypothetical protein